MHTVALIDYGSGNLHSAHKALVRASGGASKVVVTSDPKTIAAADRILLPGVGAFGACMAALSARDGVIAAMDEAVRARGIPFLGVCVGMQLLATVGTEYGRTEGLGWIDGEVRALAGGDGLKMPHMGWNDVIGQGHPLLPPDGDAYFVHSYKFVPQADDSIAATCEYGERFPAMIARGNIAGVQFHPEKSQAYGLALLENFLKWDPK